MNEWRGRWMDKPPGALRGPGPFWGTAARGLTPGGYGGGRVVTPARDGGAVRRVRGPGGAVGARPVEGEAAVHDRAGAFLGRLPQVVGWALAAAARGDAEAGRWLSLAGPGFHDMTRLARS